MLEVVKASETMSDFMACTEIPVKARVDFAISMASTLVDLADMHLDTPARHSLDLDDYHYKAEMEEAAAFQRKCDAVNAANDAQTAKNKKLYDHVLWLTGEVTRTEAAKEPQPKKRNAEDSPPEKQPQKRRDIRVRWLSLHKSDNTFSWK